MLYIMKWGIAGSAAAPRHSRGWC